MAAASCLLGVGYMVRRAHVQLDIDVLPLLLFKHMTMSKRVSCTGGKLIKCPFNDCGHD